MFEVELKAVLSESQAASLPERLAALGFLPGEWVQERDLYWNAPDRDFRHTGEALRLRTVSGSRDMVLLTYKGPREDAPVKSRPEYETAVADAQTARSILLSLGYVPSGAVEKERRTFDRAPITACLDHVALLGSFLELEHLVAENADRARAADELLSLLDRLGISRTALERRSYLELISAASAHGGGAPL